LKPADLPAVEIAEAIRQRFANLSNEFIDAKSDRERTGVVKKTIGNLGLELGWMPGTAGHQSFFGNEGEGEWLYDLIWYRNTPERHLSEVYLVLESEWKSKLEPIRVDFEKLLLAKAWLKVLVFQSNGINILKWIDFLEKGIHVFQKRSAGEIYVIAAFNTNTRQFEVKKIDGV
jgi:hypothetical protein